MLNNVHMQRAWHIYHTGHFTTCPSFSLLLNVTNSTETVTLFKHIGIQQASNNNQYVCLPFFTTSNWLHPLLASCLTLAPHYLEWVTPEADPGVVTAPSALVGANFHTPGKACLSSFELQVPAGLHCCSPKQRVYKAAHAAASRTGFRIPSRQRVRVLQSAPPTSLATTCDHWHERTSAPWTDSTRTHRLLPATRGDRDRSQHWTHRAARPHRGVPA